jgi:uncharacterized membrane protein
MRIAAPGIGNAAPTALELLAWAAVMGLYLTEVRQLALRAADDGHAWNAASVWNLAAAGFAAYSAALAWRGWQGLSRAHRQVGLVCAAAAVVLLLVAGLSASGPYAMVLLQPRGAAYALFAAGLAVMVGLLGRRTVAGDGERLWMGPLTVAAHVAVLVLFTMEARDFWLLRGDRWFQDADQAWYARHATLSVGYAVYAIGLLAAGIARRRALLRIMALLLLAVTIGKVFMFDLRRIEAIWRVLSVFGLGLLLLAGSLLYHKYSRLLFGEQPPADRNGEGGS